VSRERTSFEPSSMQIVLSGIKSSFEIWKNIQTSVLPKATNDFCLAFLVPLLEFASAPQIVKFLLSWIGNFDKELQQDFPDLKAAEVLFKAAKYCTDESNIPSFLMFLRLMSIENKSSSLEEAFDPFSSQILYESSFEGSRSNQPLMSKRNEKSERNLQQTTTGPSKEPVFELRNQEIKPDARISNSQTFSETKPTQVTSKNEEIIVPPPMSQGFATQNLAQNSNRFDAEKLSRKEETIIPENPSKKVAKKVEKKVEDIPINKTVPPRQSLVTESVSQNKVIKPSVSPLKSSQTGKEGQNIKKTN